MKSACFRRLTPLNSFAGARCDATCYPRGQCFSTGLSCTVREAERCRASARAMRRWETSSGAPETGLEHCAWSPSVPRVLGAGSTRPQGGLGWWAVTSGDGAVRAGAHEGDAWRGGQGAGWSTRGCSPRGSRLCVARAPRRGSLAHARFLDPFASKGVPRLSRRGGKTRGARGWWRQRRRGGPRRRGRGDGGGARVWTAMTRAVRRSARVGRRRGGGEGGGARGGYRWRWAAVEKGGDREGGGGH